MAEDSEEVLREALIEVEAGEAGTMDLGDPGEGIEAGVEEVVGN